MPRALFVAIACLVASAASVGQAPSVLHIKVVLIDKEGVATPVPRHALLVSANPANATPRRIVTALDGTADVTLRPGNYTVESDQPVVFQGSTYQWTELVDITPGRDSVLELTAGNAEVESASAASTTTAAPPANDPSFLLPQWQNSVVTLWTSKLRAAGFVIDAKGLVITSQRVIGSETSAEVQLTPELKVTARVLAADPVRDVAVLRIAPAVAASLRPVPLGCGQSARPSIAEGQEILAIVAPLREPRGLRSGTVSRVEQRAIGSDLRFPPVGAGGPVFSVDGAVIGITSIANDNDDSSREVSWVVPIEQACEVVIAAEKSMAATAPPSADPLPLEPTRPFPLAALKKAVEGRAGSLSPYQMLSSDFDIAFITPVQIYGAQHQVEQTRPREPGKGVRPSDPEGPFVRSVMDFRNWSDYVAESPPVLLVRVTPRLVEGFWTTVARGAAWTQGVALPPIKRLKPGFSRLKVLCGSTEVIPIHPFKLEQRLSENEAINEGLYVFDPGALGPHCPTVTLRLSSEKAPDTIDTRLVEPRIIGQIWQDFAPYR